MEKLLAEFNGNETTVTVMKLGHFFFVTYIDSKRTERHVSNAFNTVLEAIEHFSEIVEACLESVIEADEEVA